MPCARWCPSRAEQSSGGPFPFGTFLKGLFFRVGLRMTDVMPIPTSILPTGLPNHAATSRSAKWKPWLWRPMNLGTSLSKARGASIEMSRRRVERQAIDIFIARSDRDRRP